MTQASVNPAGLAGTAGPVDEYGSAGPVGRFMSAVIRTLAWSRLSKPKVAITVCGAGLLLGIAVGATAPNAETVPVRLPLSSLLPSLNHTVIIPTALLPGARGDALGT